MWKKEDKKALNTLIKRVSIIIGIKIIIIFFFFLQAEKKIWSTSTGTTYEPQFCFNWNCIDLEIAKTPQERELGLMFREKMDENKGMVFIFDWPWKHEMWMRNTLIPLDIIRITSGYKVVDIISAPPCNEETCPTYKPEIDNLRAIEVNGGIAEKIELETGNIIELNI